MIRTLLTILVVIILTAGLAWAQSPGPPTIHAGGGAALVYSFSGEVFRPAVTWSLALTKAPSVPLIADGLLIADGDLNSWRYGVGVATPLPTLTDPLLSWMHLTPSEGFNNVLNAVQVGGAVLTDNSRDFDGGLYAKVTAFTW